MTTQHTPGPWEFSYHGDSYNLRGKGERIFSIINGVIPMNADAKLIAAAPDMLAALQSILEWANWACGCSGNDECAGCYDDMALQQARAAINKAISP